MMKYTQRKMLLSKSFLDQKAPLGGVPEELWNNRGYDYFYAVDLLIDLLQYTSGKFVNFVVKFECFRKRNRRILNTKVILQQNCEKKKSLFCNLHIFARLFLEEWRVDGLVWSTVSYNYVRNVNKVYGKKPSKPSISSMSQRVTKSHFKDQLSRITH